MSDANKKRDLFLLRLLTSIESLKEQRVTAEKVREGYLRFYPPGFFRRKILPPIGIDEIERGLRALTLRGFLQRELTILYEDRVLAKDTPIYSLTSMGEAFLRKR